MSLRLPARDDGTALVMVLVFVLVVAVVVGALLDQSFTTFRSARVTSQLTDRVFAANGGAEWGVQQLRQGVLANGVPACAVPSTPAAPVPLPGSPLTLNGRQVAVTCEVESGSATGVAGWSVFITDATGGITVHAGADATKVVYGPVYDAGPFTRVGNVDLQLTNGDVVSCTGAVPSFVRTSPGLARTVVTSCPPVVVPAPPAAAASIADMTFAAEPPVAGTDVGSCRVFEPGRYTVMPELIPATAGSNYLRSGVYYLDDTIEDLNVLDDVVVVGGAPGPRETPRTGARDRAIADGCPVEQPEDTAGHYGVVFVFGGRSRVEVRGPSLVELFGYVEPDAGGAGGASVYQLRNEWGASEASRVTGPGVALLATGVGSPAQLAVHGAVYAPRARISAFGTGTSRVGFLGGVVAAGLDLQAGSFGPEGAHVSNQVATGSRTIRLVATTNSVGSEKNVSTTAMLEVLNDARRTTNVTSWVVDQ